MAWNTAINSWENSFKYTLTYDAAFNKTSQLFQLWDNVPASWINSENHIYTYDFANNMTVADIQLWQTSTQTWQTQSLANYTYDSNKNEIYREFQFRNELQQMQFSNNEATMYNCTTVGINETSSLQTAIHLFPNPATTTLHISSAKAFTKTKVLDLNGRTLLEGTGNDLNITDLNTGVYFVQLLGESDVIQTQKFIKE